MRVVLCSPQLQSNSADCRLEGEGERDSGDQDKRQFSWWNYHVNEKTGERAYANVEDAIEFVATVCREQGPFDGVFGFSQGGMLASFVLQRQRE